MLAHAQGLPYLVDGVARRPVEPVDADDEGDPLGFEVVDAGEALVDAAGVDQDDGTFTRTRTPGEGVTAQALRAAGIAVHSEEDVSPPEGDTLASSQGA